MAESKDQSVVKQAAAVAARQDPAPRPLAGVGNEMRGRDPSRWYVLVNTNAVTHGVEFYEELGYMVERQREGGPRIRAGRTSKDGEAVMFQGHVMMSIPLETANRLAYEGSDLGGLGTKHWDELEKRLLDKRFSPLGRMPGSEYMRTINRSEVRDETGIL